MTSAAFLTSIDFNDYLQVLKESGLTVKELSKRTQVNYFTLYRLLKHGSTYADAVLRICATAELMRAEKEAGK